MTTTTISAPQVIKEAIILPSVAMKLLHLEKISNHPCFPYLIDSMTKILDMSMEKNLSLKETHIVVNYLLEGFIDQFKKYSK